MKKVAVLILTLSLIVPLVACRTKTEPTTTEAPETTIEETTKEQSDELTEADALAELLVFLQTSSHGAEEMTDAIMAKAPHNTAKIKNWDISTIECDRDSIFNYDEQKIMIIYGSFYAYDKYDSLIDKCTFDVQYTVKKLNSIVICMIWEDKVHVYW